MKNNIKKINEFLTDFFYSFFILEYENIFEDRGIKENVNNNPKEE
ncbi:hypothetical protein [Alteribacillus bidgolensis]|nr:hypothetical protein [Alteribacillus bidgolensis]